MANEKRLIDANALLKSHWWDSLTDEFNKIRAKIIIMSAPTVDAVEVVHGRWNMDEEMYAWNCSVCRSISLNGRRYSYCHNCGAKMDGDGK